MQVFANVATPPTRKESKSGKVYWEFRVAEAQKNDKGLEPTWYSCRVMREEDPKLSKGDFVKVTGKLKADFYLSREGKPTGTLLIIAFDATKIAKPSAATVDVAAKADESTKAGDTSAAAAIPPAVSLPMGATAAPTPVSSTAQAVPPSQEAQPVPAKQQFASMQTLPSFALPSPVASPWAMSFAALVPAK